MIERNRALVLRWFEDVWNRRIDSAAEELAAPGAIGHMEGIEIVGPAAFLKVRAALLAAFPDLKITIEDSIAEGDNVVVRWRAAGTHLGEGFGVGATRAPVAFRGMSWHHVVDGQIVEAWDAWNEGALVESLRLAKHE
jgi:predicted ester cyclase